MPRTSVRGIIAATRALLDESRRYVDLAVRLVVYDRGDSGELVRIGAGRVYGGRWDMWRRAYSPLPPERVVEIPVSRKQYAIATGMRPRTLVHAGRGGGKSHALCVWMLICALEIPHGAGQFLSPTAKKSRVLWRKMLKHLPSARFLRPGKAGISKQPPELTLVNGFVLGFETSGAEAVGRGEDNDVLGIDERQAIAQGTIDAAVMTCRKAGGYRMMQIGTPDIDSDFYEEYERYIQQPDLCEVITATSYDNPFSAHDVFAAQLGLMDARTYAQEVEGKWVSSKGAVYWMFHRDLHILRRRQWSEVDDVDITAQVLDRFADDAHAGSKYDYAVGVDYPRRAVIAKIYNDGRAGGLRVIDAVELGEDSTPWQLAAELKRRGYANSVVFDDVGHGDKASRSESGIMRSQGFRVVHGTRNPRVKDRVNSVCGKLGAADGHVSLVIDEPQPQTATGDQRNCVSALIRCLERQQRGVDGAPDKKAGFDHFPDALGYLVWRLWPIRSLDEEERRRQEKERMAA